MNATNEQQAAREQGGSAEAGRYSGRPLGVLLAMLISFFGVELAPGKGSGERISSTQAWNELAGSRSGRVVLHTVCLFRHPEKARWHWRGILREFHI